MLYEICGAVCLQASLIIVATTIVEEINCFLRLRENNFFPKIVDKDVLVENVITTHSNFSLVQGMNEEGISIEGVKVQTGRSVNRTMYKVLFLHFITLIR